MAADFLHTTLTGISAPVHRLGLAASYWPGKKAIYAAIDEGVNFFFFFNIDRQMIAVLRDVLRRDREKYIVATGAYNLIWGHPDVRRTLEKRLRQLRIDYIDAFLFLGVMKPGQFPENVRDELRAIRAEGKVRGIGLSSHDRKFAGKLAASGEVDVIMMRYNAAHRGAEQDIFPYLSPHNPGIVSYTATRWTYLLRRPRGWSKSDPVPTAGMCYRFVLSNPGAQVCLTAPRSTKQLRENLQAVSLGPLGTEEMEFMRRFGDAVRNATRSIYSLEERRPQPVGGVNAGN